MGLFECKRAAWVLSAALLWSCHGWAQQAGDGLDAAPPAPPRAVAPHDAPHDARRGEPLGAAALDAMDDMDDEDAMMMGRHGMGGMRRQGGMRMAGPWTPARETTFLSGMIAHHQGALAMADAVLKKGKDPQVGKWATRIAAAQKDEIDRMREMLRKRGTSDPASAEKMRRRMDAMMGASYDPDPDRDFVLMMIPHHAQAVMMSLPPLTRTDDPELRTLAKNIIADQAAEIAAFRDWLDKHPAPPTPPAAPPPPPPAASAP